MVNCVICGIRPAVGKGEHVWPAWFLKDADAAGDVRSPMPGTVVAVPGVDGQTVDTGG